MGVSIEHFRRKVESALAPANASTRDCDARTRSPTAAPARCPSSRMLGRRDAGQAIAATGSVLRTIARQDSVLYSGRRWTDVFRRHAQYIFGASDVLGATWRSGYATVCKTVYPGSIPGVASKTSHPGIREKVTSRRSCGGLFIMPVRPVPRLPQPPRSGRAPSPSLVSPRGGKCHLIAAMQQCIAVMQQVSVIPLVYQNI